MTKKSNIVDLNGDKMTPGDVKIAQLEQKVEQMAQAMVKYQVTINTLAEENVRLSQALMDAKVMVHDLVSE